MTMAGQLESGGNFKPPHYLRPGPVKRLHEAIEAAKAVSPSHYPVKHRKGEGPRLDIDETKLEKIRRFRDKKADELNLEPTLLATRTVMERLASNNLSEEEKGEALLSWQRELLQPVLP